MSGLENHPNVLEVMKEDHDIEGPAEVINPTFDEISKRIKHILTIYPCISPSMLQVGIGTGLPPSIWRPVLEKMITDKQVYRKIVAATNPGGRSVSYKVLHLAEPEVHAAPSIVTS